MKGNQRADIKIGQYITVHNNECVINAGMVGREANCPCCIKRFGLDGIVQPYAGTSSVGEGFNKRFGLEAKTKDYFIDASRRQHTYQVFNDWAVPNGQHWLRRREGKWSQSGTKPADENHRAHQPAVVVGPAGAADVVALGAVVVTGTVVAPATVVDDSPATVVVDSPGTVLAPATVVVV